jgi:hypothetical protein
MLLSWYSVSVTSNGKYGRWLKRSLSSPKLWRSKNGVLLFSFCSSQTQGSHGNHLSYHPLKVVDSSGLNMESGMWS